MSIADKERWDRFFNGFSIYDCAYGYEDRYVFLAYEKTDSPHRDPLPELRIVVARMERPMDKRFYRMQFPYFDFARVAYTSSPESEFVAVDIVGQTYSYNPPRSDEEERHPTQLKCNDPAKPAQVKRLIHRLPQGSSSSAPGGAVDGCRSDQPGGEDDDAGDCGGGGV